MPGSGRFFFARRSMKRLYLCRVIGTGTIDDPYRPAIEGSIIGGVDLRPDSRKPDGEMLVEVDLTPEEYDRVKADRSVVEIDGGNADVELQKRGTVIADKARPVTRRLTR